MNKPALLASVTPLVAVLTLSFAPSGVQAHGSVGTEVDNTCSSFNGTKPYTAGGTQKCSLCHQDNRSIRHEPEWTWALDGQGSAGQKNFCTAQGIIVKPEAGAKVPKGGTVDLAARGFSPTQGIGAVSFTWSFSDRPNTLSGAVQTAVPVPNAGDVVVTLNAQDSTGASDTTPDQRTVTVANVPTAATNDGYNAESGNLLSVPAPGVLANDTGLGKITVTMVNNATQGFLNLGVNGGFEYTPNTGFAGTDSFTYTASNGITTSAPATVTLVVSASPPIAKADRYAMEPNKANTRGKPGILANDAGSGPLTVKVTESPTQGKLTLTADGSFKYVPKRGFTGTDSFKYVASNSAGSSSPTEVRLDVGNCTDKDKDGYSREGGSCGPIDCNDNVPTVNPAVREKCGNGTDDDCNGLADRNDPGCTGTDCIGKLLSEQANITLANWNGKTKKLVVKGLKAPRKASVNVSDADSGALLGTVKVTKSGSWKFVQQGVAVAPCRVTVEINGAAGNRAVQGAPTACVSPEGPACAVSR
jgi:hypothetical protein